MITFHVVYTAGTTESLLPMAYSLLRAPEARFLLVDNHCAPEESLRMQRVADSEDRFEYYRLPFPELARHGTALEHLFRRGAESIFAILDSDVLATGDFFEDLANPPEGCGALCSAWPLWIEDREAACHESQPFVGGPYRVLADGTEVGGTAFALYDRRALDAALRSEPSGLVHQTSGTLAPETLGAFRERGWDPVRFGTARVAHMRMILRGNAVVNRDSAHLHHIGGLSHAGEIDPGGPGARLRRVTALMLRGPSSPAINAVTNLRRRLSGPGRGQAIVYDRKRKLVRHVRALMESLRNGHSPPAPIGVGSAEVDARLEILTSALARDYPGYCERVRSLVD